MKSISCLLACVAMSIAAHAAPAANPAVAIWKDVGACMPEAVGKVVSAKDAKVGGKPGVEVKSKAAKGGKVFTTGIQGLKATDFAVGSDFCKVDFGAD